jgi:hypothetical protein
MPYALCLAGIPYDGNSLALYLASNQCRQLFI